MPTAIATPTTPTYLSPAPVPAVLLASGNTFSPASPYTLNLKGKKGAVLFVRIGRTVATALTRGGFVVCRRTNNDTMYHPFSAYDTETISSTTAAGSTTLNGNTSIGAASVVVTNATSLAVGDLVAFGTNAARVEFAMIHNINSTTITLDRPLRLAHTSGDTFTTLATIRTFFIPGGDIWEIYARNNSEQTLIFHVEGYVEDSDTVTY